MTPMSAEVWQLASHTDESFREYLVEALDVASGSASVMILLGV